MGDGMQIRLAFGPLAPPLERQLRDQGLVFTGRGLDLLQRHAESLASLHLHEVITDAAFKRAHRILLGRIRDNVVPAPDSPPSGPPDGGPGLPMTVSESENEMRDAA